MPTNYPETPVGQLPQTAASPKPKRPPPRPTKKGKERSQQDNIWKEVLDDFFRYFMLFFFPDYYRDVDWKKGYESLDKEMIEVTQKGGFGNQAADKLFKVFLKDGSQSLMLMHVEVQGYKDDDFAERVRDYNYLIHRKYKQRVLSFAVLTDPHEDFRPTGYRWQYRRHLELYNFPMVKLLA